jgi:hypothetical protein
MGAEYTILIAAVAALLSAAATWLTASARYKSALAKQAEGQGAQDAPSNEERERIAGRSEDLATRLTEALTDWSERTPERVKLTDCRDRHSALGGKIDALARDVKELGNRVSHLAGVVEGRRNGGRS